MIIIYHSIHSVYRECRIRGKQSHLHVRYKLFGSWGCKSTVDYTFLICHVVECLGITVVFFQNEKYFNESYGVVSVHKTNVLYSDLHTFLKPCNTCTKSDKDS